MRYSSASVSLSCFFTSAPPCAAPGPAGPPRAPTPGRPCPGGPPGRDWGCERGVETWKPGPAEASMLYLFTCCGRGGVGLQLQLAVVPWHGPAGAGVGAPWCCAGLVKEVGDLLHDF